MESGQIRDKAALPSPPPRNEAQYRFNGTQLWRRECLVPVGIPTPAYSLHFLSIYQDCAIWRTFKKRVQHVAGDAGLSFKSFPSLSLLFTYSSLHTIYSAWPRYSKILGRNWEKRAFHGVWRQNQSVQTRFPKPEDKHFLHGGPRSWCVCEEKIKRWSGFFLPSMYTGKISGLRMY